MKKTIIAALFACSITAGSLAAEIFPISVQFEDMAISAQVDAQTMHRSCIGPYGHAAWDGENGAYYSFQIFPANEIGEIDWTQDYPGDVESVELIPFDAERSAEIVTAVDQSGFHHVFMVISLDTDGEHLGKLVLGVEMTGDAYEPETLVSLAQAYFDTLDIHQALEA